MKLIDIIKKNKDYILIFESSNIISNENTIIRYYLRKNMEISDELYENIKNDSLFYSFYDAAVNYLSKGLKSKQKIRYYLRNKGASDEIIDNAINLLEERKLIDDTSYFESISDYYLRRGYGPYYIRMKGSEEGIEESLINDIIYKIDKENYISYLEPLIDKYVKSNKEKDLRKLKEKTKKYLYSRGFEMDMIISKVEEYFNENR